LALALLEGDGVPRDEDRALALFERACEAKIQAGCGWAAHLYLRRGEDERGAALMDRTCEHDVAWACTFAAELIRQGRGVERDPERAQRTLEKACRLEDERACERLRASEVRGTWGD
jgi:TPR repeat protein